MLMLAERNTMTTILRAKLWRLPALLLALALAAVIPMVTSAQVSPPSFSATLQPGQSTTVTKTVQTPSIPPNPDIAFLADTTGSMGPEIANVKANAGTVLSTILTAQPTAQFSVSEYRDIFDAFRFRVNRSLTSNQAAVQNAINGWSAGGGGDRFEAQLPALRDLANGVAGWRTGSTRIVVWFGDEPGHDPRAGVTEAAATNALTAAGVQVVAVSVRRLDQTGQATRITNATGGSLQSSGAGVSAAILAGLQNLPVTVTPVAVGCAPLNVTFSPSSQTVTSGATATFSETISVPTGTTSQTVNCTVEFRTNGTSIGSQTITITVQADSDGAVVSMNVLNPPATINVSDNVPVTVREVVHNFGPLGPTDFNVIFNAAAPPGCDIVGPNQIVVPVTLPVSVDTNVDAVFTIHCSEPSEHTFRFDNEITVTTPGIRDPNPGNNTGSTSLTVASIAQADLAIKSWDLSAAPRALLISRPRFFPTTKVVHNFGDTVNVPPRYSRPVDANVWKTMEIPAGIEGSVHVSADEAPAKIVIERPGQAPEVLENQPASTVVKVVGPARLSVHFMVLGLEVSKDRAITEEFDIHCLEPSRHTIKFINKIMAKDQHIEDPDLSNNVRTIEHVVECVTPVQINIKPGSDPNSINPGKGVIPVAILTTDAGEYGLPIAFDATTIDPLSVRFGTRDQLRARKGAEESHGRGHIEDSKELDEVTMDGDPDMVLHFKAADTGIDENTTAACVVGTYSGADGALHRFFGCDSVRIPPGGGGPSPGGGKGK